MSKERSIPFHRPSLDAKEEAAVLEVFRSGWLTTGEKTKAAEEKLSEFTGCSFALGLNSCTAGLHLSLLAFGIGPGDEVIVPPITFPSVANVVQHVGATVVFADVDPNTINISPTEIEKAISPKTKGLIITHLYGQSCDLAAIRKICDQHSICLIQDAAHALESTYKGKHVAQYGDVTCFSFYATKNITSGEGGALVTNREDIAQKISAWRIHGLTRDAWQRHGLTQYRHWDIAYPGFKYNMYDVQAAVLLCQLDKIPSFLEARQKIASIYDESLSVVRELVRRPGRNTDNQHCFHLYPLVLNEDKLSVKRDDLLSYLGEKNIGVGVHFRPVHQMKYYRENQCFRAEDLSHSEQLGSRLFSLPIFPALNHADAQYVADVLVDYLRQHTR